MRHSRLPLLVCAWLFALASVSTAQTGTSNLVGQVNDNTGGALPGVSVTAVQAETNYRFEAVTNEVGAFRSKVAAW